MFLACQCGKFFQPKDGSDCCRECRKHRKYLERKKKPQIERISTTDEKPKRVFWKKGHICQWCASVFTKKHHGSRNDGKYCSRQCRFDYLAWRTETRKVQEQGDRWNSSITIPCVVCLIPFDTSGSGPRICSDECRKKHASHRAREKYIPKEPGFCGDCGVRLESAMQDYCRKCSRARARQAKQIQNRSRKRIIRINTVETVNPLVVYERDGWVCQLCFGKVKRNAQMNDPMEPTLDHIIPISKGGEHSYKNVQCSHRQCNVAKNNKNEGQLRLFG